MAKDDVYTKDGTVDYHGNPASKKETGTWKACPFILGNCGVYNAMMDKISYWLGDGMLTISNLNFEQEMNAVRDWLIMVWAPIWCFTLRKDYISTVLLLPRMCRIGVEHAT